MNNTSRNKIRIWAKRIFTIIVGYFGMQILYSVIFLKLLGSHPQNIAIYELAAFATIVIATCLYYIGRHHGHQDSIREYLLPEEKTEKNK